jgi:hypothetical protein
VHRLSAVSRLRPGRVLFPNAARDVGVQDCETCEQGAWNATLLVSPLRGKRHLEARS